MHVRVVRCPSTCIDPLHHRATHLPFALTLPPRVRARTSPFTPQHLFALARVSLSLQYLFTIHLTGSAAVLDDQTMRPHTAS